MVQMKSLIKMLDKFVAIVLSNFKRMKMMNVYHPKTIVLFQNKVKVFLSLSKWCYQVYADQSSSLGEVIAQQSKR